MRFNYSILEKHSHIFNIGKYASAYIFAPKFKQVLLIWYVWENVLLSLILLIVLWRGLLLTWRLLNGRRTCEMRVTSFLLELKTGWEMCLLWMDGDLPLCLYWNRKQGVENRLDVWKPALGIYHIEKNHTSSSQAMTSGWECWQRNLKKKKKKRQLGSLWI